MSIKGQALEQRCANLEAALNLSIERMQNAEAALREAVAGLRRIEAFPIACRGAECPGCEAGRINAAIAKRVKL
jgi:hypothetical protein